MFFFDENRGGAVQIRILVGLLTELNRKRHKLTYILLMQH
jgi:hypothetical protein